MGGNDEREGVIVEWKLMKIRGWRFILWEDKGRFPRARNRRQRAGSLEFLWDRQVFARQKRL